MEWALDTGGVKGRVGSIFRILGTKGDVGGGMSLCGTFAAVASPRRKGQSGICTARRRTITGQQTVWSVEDGCWVLWRFPTYTQGTHRPGLRGGMGLWGSSGARGSVLARPGGLDRPSHPRAWQLA